MGEHLCFSTISLGVNIVCHYQLCLAIRQGADVFFWAVWRIVCLPILWTWAMQPHDMGLWSNIISYLIMGYLLLDQVWILIHQLGMDTSWLLGIISTAIILKPQHFRVHFPRSRAGDSDDSWPLDAEKRGIGGQTGGKMELYFFRGFLIHATAWDSTHAFNSRNSIFEPMVLALTPTVLNFQAGDLIHHVCSQIRSRTNLHIARHNLNIIRGRDDSDKGIEIQTKLGCHSKLDLWLRFRLPLLDDDCHEGQCGGLG